MLTATTANLSLPSLPSRLSSAGISLRHGTHQVAHRFNRTVRPFQSDSFFATPSPSTNARSGICSGLVAIVTAATSPLASGAIFFDNSTAAPQGTSASALRFSPATPYTPANPIAQPTEI